MPLDRALGEHQPGCDLAVAHALRYHHRNLELASCQLDAGDLDVAPIGYRRWPCQGFRQREGLLNV